MLCKSHFRAQNSERYKEILESQLLEAILKHAIKKIVASLFKKYGNFMTP